VLKEGQSQSLRIPQLVSASAKRSVENRAILFIVKEFILQRNCKLAT